MSVKAKRKKVAILGAMPQEVNAYIGRLKKDTPGGEIISCGETVHGRWAGKDAIVSYVGISKPIAAIRTTNLITRFGPDVIIFTGVAGALDKRLKIGDIGVVQYAIDADLDVRVWKESPEVADYKLGELPFTRERIYRSDKDLASKAIDSGLVDFTGYVATGSQFLDREGKLVFSKQRCSDLIFREGTEFIRPNIYDMESSAVLQAAKDRKVPALIIRAVSDGLDGDAGNDFNEFVKESVKGYVGLVDYLLENFGNKNDI
jgi:5'-methylthioadenosine/S-adenosylhomocysteine nucleosidase